MKTLQVISLTLSLFLIAHRVSAQEVSFYYEEVDSLYEKSSSAVSIVRVYEDPLQEVFHESNALQALQGRVPGLEILHRGYGSNTDPLILIRGYNSFATNSNPLILLDGIPIHSSVNIISMEDIGSIEVVKDVSAGSIYGATGNNGIIHIHTKVPENGKLKVNLNSSLSIKNPLRFFDKFSGGEWMEMNRDLRRNSGRYEFPYPDPVEDYYSLVTSHYNLWESVKAGYEWNNDGTVATRPVTDEERNNWAKFMEEVPDEIPIYNPENVRSYNWYGDALNKNSLTQNHHFSISKGSEHISTRFSLAYLGEEGLGIGEMKRMLVPALLMKVKPFKWLELGIHSRYSNTLTDPGEDLLNSAGIIPPIALPYDSLGNFLILPTDYARLRNPLNDPELNSVKRVNNSYYGSYYAALKFAQHFKFQLIMSQELGNSDYSQYHDQMSAYRYPNDNEVYISYNDFTTISLNNQLSYERAFGDHLIHLGIYQNIRRLRDSSNYFIARDIDYDSYTSLWDIADSLKVSWSSNSQTSQLTNYAAYTKYSYKNRYIAAFSLGIKSVIGFETGYYPSAALTWKLSEEEFMSNLNTLNELKFRISYGHSGNPLPVNLAINNLLPTDDLILEKTVSGNLGLDFGLFNNKLYGSIDLYRSDSKDLLLPKTTFDGFNYVTILSNQGRIRNEGIEVGLHSLNIFRGDFVWFTDLNLSHNSEQIQTLTNGAEDDLNNYYFIGQPLKVFYSYEYDGIWQTSDSALMSLYNSNGSQFRVGNVRVKDVDENDTIDFRDRTILGNGSPSLYGSLSNRIYFKGFELSFSLFFQFGQGIYNRANYINFDPRYSPRFQVDYYKPFGSEEENALAEYPAPLTTRDRYEEALYYKEASFMKIRHITYLISI